MSETPQPSRRDFLSGRAVREKIDRAREQLAELATREGELVGIPSAGDTVRLVTRAMACDFAVIMNPGPSEQVMSASRALDLVYQLESQMSVYRADSELSQINRDAGSCTVGVEEKLFGLLTEARRIAVETERAFDPTSGPLIALWRDCRNEGRIPTDEELAQCLSRIGIEHVRFDHEQCELQFDREGVELNLGGIGKGYALDCLGEELQSAGLCDWMVHGGYSSILASGDHRGQGGWPVGLKNPLFPQQRWATLLVQDEAVSTSGSGVQSFRYEGKRYGHILDPRSGWPVDGMLSVTVLAPTAAEADALSTAFFVMGVEKSLQYCDNYEMVKAILIPSPSGRRLEPVLIGVEADRLFVQDEFSL